MRIRISDFDEKLKKERRNQALLTHENEKLRFLIESNGRGREELIGSLEEKIEILIKENNTLEDRYIRQTKEAQIKSEDIRNALNKLQEDNWQLKQHNDALNMKNEQIKQQLEFYRSKAFKGTPRFSNSGMQAAELPKLMKLESQFTALKKQYLLERRWIESIVKNGMMELQGFVHTSFNQLLLKKSRVEEQGVFGESGVMDFSDLDSSKSKEEEISNIPTRQIFRERPRTTNVSKSFNIQNLEDETSQISRRIAELRQKEMKIREKSFHQHSRSSFDFNDANETDFGSNNENRQGNKENRFVSFFHN